MDLLLNVVKGFIKQQGYYNMTLNKKEFNIVIVGTGGQGLITLLQILAETALSDGYDVKTSELHGLSQRGGSVETHIRFGKKIFSPLIPRGKADLILGLEMQECLNACYFANKQTIFLINKFFIPILDKKILTENEILKELRKITKNIIVVPAAEICEKKTGKNILSGIYLLSYACFQKIIPLKPDLMLKAIEKVVPEKYLELNKKIYRLAISQNIL